MLLAKGAEVNAKTKSGRTPLHEAVEYSSKEVVELLVSKGADVTAKNEKGLTPVQCAEEHGHTDIVALLRQSLK